MPRGAALTLVVILALTAAITAASLDVAAAYLWRPLPYPAADRLVVVDYPRANGPSVRDLMSVDARALDGVADLRATSDPDSFTVIGGDAPFTTGGRWTGADVFAMFDVVPVVGRVFTRDEADRGERVAMISYEVWQEHFAGRRDAIGRAITIRAAIRRGSHGTFTLIGVLPRRFWHIEERTDVIVPLPSTRAPWLMRLGAGVPVEDAAARLTSMIRSQISGVGPQWTAVVRSARDAHVDAVRPILTSTSWGIVMLAFVALANLAFLQIARGVSRQRELAVRQTLGAGRSDVLRLMLREGFAIGVTASVGGVGILWLLSAIGGRAVEQYFGRLIPGASTLGADLRVYAALAVGTTALGAAFSMVMLAAARHTTLASALAGNPTSTDSPTRLTIRQGIVAMQVAVAFSLLVGAALMVRTAWHLGHQDLGFDPRSVLSANLTLPEDVYRTLDDRRDMFRRVIDRVQQLPDVEHAGLTGWLPFRIGASVSVIPEDSPQTSASASMQGVDGGYFTALGMRLQRGRTIDAADRAGRDNAAVISESLSRELWGGADPIGRTLRIKFSPEPGRGFGPFTVVGVIDAVKQSVMRETPPQLYLAFYQQPLAGNAFLQLKTRVDPQQVIASIARIVRDLDPNLALGSITTLESLVEQEGLRPRLLARALAGFAVLAIVIATIGLYAVSARIAQLRQREAALRIALGADRSAVTALLARRGLIAVAAGLLLGWIVTWPMSASLAPQLHGVNANDIATRLFTGLLMLGVSTAALLGPVWRASTANLASLLRDQ